jgi:hypothetical protein
MPVTSLATVSRLAGEQACGLVAGQVELRRATLPFGLSVLARYEREVWGRETPTKNAIVDSTVLRACAHSVEETPPARQNHS